MDSTDPRILSRDAPRRPASVDSISEIEERSLHLVDGKEFGLQQCVNAGCDSRKSAAPFRVTEDETAGVICITCGMVNQPGGKLMSDTGPTIKEAESDLGRTVAAHRREATDLYKDETMHERVKLEDACIAATRKGRIQDLTVNKSVLQSRLQEKLKVLDPAQRTDIASREQIASIQDRLLAIERRLQEQGLQPVSTPTPGTALALAQRRNLLKRKTALSSPPLEEQQQQQQQQEEEKNEAKRMKTDPDLADASKLLGIHEDLLQSLTAAQQQRREATQEYQKRRRELRNEEKLLVRSIDLENMTEQKTEMSMKDINKELAERKRVVEMEALAPRVDAVFVYMYRRLCNNAAAEYRTNPVHVAWYRRTLESIVEYKLHRRIEENKQLRDVERYTMHAIILTSWQETYPLSWSKVYPWFADYRILQAKEEVRIQLLKQAATTPTTTTTGTTSTPAPMNTGEDSDSSTVATPDICPRSIPRRESLEKELVEFASICAIPVNWEEQVRKITLATLQGLKVSTHQLEEQLHKQIDSCVRLYSSAEEGRGLKLFTPAVAAAACLRKVFAHKNFPLTIEIDKSYCIIREYKADHLRKRKSRARSTIGGQTCFEFKADFFADVTGAHKKEVAACLELLG